jgi:hypothetical protein
VQEVRGRYRNQVAAFGFLVGAASQGGIAMELMQLEMFVAVVEERSVNRAAERVYRTQPAVSIALKKLETELGVPLLHRPRRGSYQLTEAGELLYDLAAKMVVLRNEAISALRPTLAMTGRLALGLAGADNVRYLAPTLDIFRDQNRGIRVELSMDTPNRLLSDLANRKIDLVFLSKSPSTIRMNPDVVIHHANMRDGVSFWLVRQRGNLNQSLRMFAEMACSHLDPALPADAGGRKKKGGATTFEQLTA